MNHLTYNDHFVFFNSFLRFRQRKFDDMINRTSTWWKIQAWNINRLWKIRNQILNNSNKSSQLKSYKKFLINTAISFISYFAQFWIIILSRYRCIFWGYYINILSVISTDKVQQQYIHNIIEILYIIFFPAFIQSYIHTIW